MFKHESTLAQYIDKGLVNKDLVDRFRKPFYEWLNEEKLRTFQKIKSYSEIICRYMRGVICESMVLLAELSR